MNKIKFKLQTLLIAIAIGFTTFSAFALDNGMDNKEKAPGFSYPSVDGTKQYSPSDFEGKYLLLDFWASWCPPCNAAAPELKRLYSEYNQKGLEILGVSIDSNEQAWKNKIEEKKWEWANIMTTDRGKEVSALYGFNAIPYFVLLDKDGNIIDKGFSINELPRLLKETIK